MNTRVDALLRPIELKGNDATHEGFYLEGIPYFQGRAYAQLSFARDVSERLKGRFDDVVISAAELINREFSSLGYVSKEAVERMENILAPVAPFAKEYTLHLVGHAHIDMNWMWGYDETVNVVLANISTILALMKEYPFLTFAQSQASVYEIIEKYGDKNMLTDIKALIKDGRWEVTATSFVENDKNMPSGESLIRQTLYTKDYLKKLLDITDADLTVAFEPDTFGHNANMPEIYAKTGIKYLYFNRGSAKTPYLSYWVGKNGEKILCHRDSRWYNARIEPILCDRLLLEADASGQKNLLCVFGTGDHGGGPTRRDINRLWDMKDWPVYPTFEFSTYKKYFEAVERDQTAVEEMSGEKNMIFTGCYSSQSRIKAANRIAERVLVSAEKYSTFDTLLNGSTYCGDKLCGAWRNVLFNQFHDILTGSCVRESKEYALAKLQESMALANTQRSYALRRIADRIDTSAFICDEDLSSDTAFGAGGGTLNAMYGNYSASSASGKNRVYTFFNSADTPRERVTEITVWDWAEPALLRFCDGDGNEVEHQVIKSDTDKYWGHSFVKVLVKVKVPAFGYTCLFLSEAKSAEFRRGELCGDMNRQHYEDSFILENERVKVKFDTVSGVILSFFDKISSKELAHPQKGGGIFRLITEDTDRDLSSWRISRYKKVLPLKNNVHITHQNKGALQNSICMEYEFENSTLEVLVSLDENSSALTYRCRSDWHERGSKESGIPQLNFVMPLNFAADSYTYDIPFGLIDRKSQNIDCPASSFISAFDAEGDGLVLHSDSKHGFRGADDSLAVTLIRASYEPDKYPELGESEFTLTLMPAKKDDAELLKSSFDLQNPFESVCQNASGGDMPLTFGFFDVTDASVTAIKYAESGDGVVIRLHNAQDFAVRAGISCFKNIKKAFMCNALEQEQNIIEINDGLVCVDLKPNSFETVKLCF